MSDSYLSEAWDDTRAFLAREHALVIPIALITIGFGWLMANLAVPESPNNAAIQPGPWMWVLLPTGLFWLLGLLTLTALALTPGASVRESLRAAFSALPRAISMYLVIGAGLVLLSLLATPLSLGSANAVESAERLILLLVVVMIVLWPRFLLGIALIVERRSPVAALGDSWRRTAPVRWRLVLVYMLVSVVKFLLVLAIKVTLGSLLYLLTRLLGAPELGPLLTMLGLAWVVAMVQAAWAIFLAFLYRRLPAR